ncbi:16.9 kDa class I heat shock protein 3-like [Asparagus officinalis]|uniref:16.9 kDa class I heat shock protein 3-like n=1 Tax=Asparagus officinalis TaxID=4686 RepID=UPI00098DF00C|nr:16.9 kDa class I heat shock protein 3-like [Asparagus officinalis]
MGKKERRGASTSLIPWAGSWTDWTDPFLSDDPWDPFWGGGANLLWGTAGRRRRGNGDGTAALADARVDWRETNTAHIFVAELPGVRKEEVKVQVEDGNVLSISGEKAKEEEDAGDTWHRIERRTGSFHRKFRLPENARMEETRCSMDNGVLTVTIPKLAEEEKPPNVRSIEVA